MKQKVKTFIFDLDGVLYNPENRMEFWHKKEYEKFHDLAELDDEHEDVCELCNVLISTEDYHITFITGRTEDNRLSTLEWLEEKLPALFVEERGCSLIMRKENDDRPDTEYKKAEYLRAIEPYCQVVGVFEDREGVVEMWRDMGLTVYALPNFFVRDRRQTR